MKLVRFSVQNFRSIELCKFELSDYTCIVGPNNAGKSNVVTALDVAIKILRAYSQIMTQDNAINRAKFNAAVEEFYDPVEDYPVALGVDSRAVPRFDLDFNLSAEEMEEFRDRFGSNTNDSLPIRIEIDRGRAKQKRVAVSVSYRKPGRGTRRVQAQLNHVARYVGEKFSLINSRAVRPGEEGMKALKGVIQKRIARHRDSNEEYRKALEVIEEGFSSEVSALGDDLRDLLTRSLPDTKSVSITHHSVLTSQLADVDVRLNDGVETSLMRKGDGVQSLFSIALVQFNGIEDRKNEQDLLSVIEEPESHMNSGALYSLRAMLDELSESQQVMVVTHSPIFVNRRDVSSNILVDGDQISNVESISEVRDALGIQVGEAMEDVEVRLLVEGETDEQIVNRILDIWWPDLCSARNEGRFEVTQCGGVKYLEHHLQMAESAAVEAYVFLDNDQASRAKLDKIKESGRYSAKRYSFVVNPRDEGKCSTIEDVARAKVLARALSEVAGIKVRAADWGKCRPMPALERAQDLVKKRGKDWDSDLSLQFKLAVASQLKGAGDFEENALPGLDALLESISMHFGSRREI